MAAPDELTYERAAERIKLLMAAIAAIGTLVALSVWGWTAGLGFLIGALLSGASFLWLKGVVSALGRGSPPRSIILLAARYLLLGVVVYVIFRLSPISKPALLAGIFVLTAAVFIEAIFEIVYARSRTLDHEDL